jgi:HAD superfamily hydrolase (TIGR01509 family)
MQHTWKDGNPHYPLSTIYYLLSNNANAVSIDAVIFDMDGVLIDSENLWQQAEKELLGQLGFDVTPDQLQETRGLITREMVRHWCNRFRITSVDPEELIRRYDSQMVEKMWTMVPLMEGAREAIRFFRDKGLAVALASCSTRELIDAVMERYGLAPGFDLVVSAADGMPGKPHPEVYLHTARLLGRDPTRCLAIEDTFYGVISALAARMKVIAIPDPREYDQPRFRAADRVICSLGEINDEMFNQLQKI